MSRRLSLAGLCLLAAASGAVAADGSFLLGGAHVARIHAQSESAAGLSVAALFRPGSVAQLSERLANARLGLSLRFNRSVSDDLAKIEGMEITARRYLGEAGQALQPYLEVGLGQNQIEFDTGGSRSIWSAVLGGGLERDLGERFLIQLDLLTRTVEFSTDSYTLTALSLSFGARFDA